MKDNVQFKQIALKQIKKEVTYCYKTSTHLQHLALSKKLVTENTSTFQQILDFNAILNAYTRPSDVSIDEAAEHLRCIKESLISVLQHVGFELLSRVMILDIGISKLKALNETTKAMLRKLESVLNPYHYKHIDYSDLELHHIPPSQQLNLEENTPFFCTPGTLTNFPEFTPFSDSQFIECCIPLPKSLMVIYAKFKKNITLDQLPHDRQMMLYNFKDFLGIKDEDSSEKRSSIMTQISQSFFHTLTHILEKAAEDSDNDSVSDSESYDPMMTDSIKSDSDEEMSDMQIQIIGKSEKNKHQKGKAKREALYPKKPSKRQKTTRYSTDIADSDSDSTGISSRTRSKRPQKKGKTKPVKSSRKSQVSIPSFQSDPLFKKNYFDHLSSQQLLLSDSNQLKRDIQKHYKTWVYIKELNNAQLNLHFQKCGIPKKMDIFRLLLSQQTSAKAALIYDKSGAAEQDILKSGLSPALLKSLDAELETLKQIAFSMNLMHQEPIDQLKDMILSNPNFPAESKSWAYRELMQLESLSESDSTYQKKLERMQLAAKIPFGKTKPLPVSMAHPATDRSQFLGALNQHLDNVAYGQKELKEKIIQIVAQLISNPEAKGKAILIAGPPGTGKTTLVREGISKGLGYYFGEIPLAGLDDSSVLKGHGYTYEGSKYGEMLRIQLAGGCENVVYFMDEVDKLGRGDHGDALEKNLIQIIDTTQNDAFKDNYVPELPINLSRCIFIFTANDISVINPTLLNRMDVVHTKPLSIREKVQIGLHYQLPKILKNIGFEPHDVIMDESTMEYLIQHSPPDPGGRTQHRIIEDLIQRLNQVRVMKETSPMMDESQKMETSPISLALDIKEFRTPHFRITKAMVDHVLKDIHFDIQKISPIPHVGQVNGMYATTDGYGGLLPIQVVTRKADEERFKLTGSQGKVMKESMEVAKTLTERLLGCNLAKHQIHIHATETATPKDGPSAGGAITVGLVSSLTQIPIRHDVSMTGEVDIKGNITKIGGLYSKLQGAKSAGVHIAFIPTENHNDLIDIQRDDPDLLDENFSVIEISTISELIEGSLISMPKLQPFSP